MIRLVLMLMAGLGGSLPEVLWAGITHCTTGPENAKRAAVVTTVSPPRTAPKNPRKVTKPDWRTEKVTFFDVTFRETNGVEVTLTRIEAETLKAGGHGQASQEEMQAAWGTTTIPPHGSLRAADQWFASPSHPDIHVRTFHGLDAHCRTVTVTVRVEEVK